MKHHENSEKLHRENLIGCRGVKLSLLKYVTITTLTTAIVTTVTITNVTIQVFEFCHNLIFIVLSPFASECCHNFELLPFEFELYHNLLFEFCRNSSF